jgi:putative hydrolase of HD superfamily
LGFREFLQSLSTMKTIPRNGWISHNVSLQDVESVADHTFSTSVLSMLLADLEAQRGSKIDFEKVLRMAILHDLAESLTFDISKAYLEYMGKKGESIKREIEKSAWEHVAKGIKEPALTRKYASAQNQYNANQTPEARIVHAADSLDILLQVVKYERMGYPPALLSDLWRESVEMVRKATLPSAQIILKLIIGEHTKLAAHK